MLPDHLPEEVLSQVFAQSCDWHASRVEQVAMSEPGCSIPGVNRNLVQAGTDLADRVCQLGQQCTSCHRIVTGVRPCQRRLIEPLI
jgi:hypothetical protein